MDSDTIAAIATPIGAGGIGIIRLSGPIAKNIAETIFLPGKIRRERLKSSTRSKKKIASHRITYGHIVDPDTGRDIDEVLLAFMAAPHSYTREDVVEIQAHGGAMILNCILDLVTKCGARIAAPGEFTQRAFVNGRIDLSQAEAVMDIIHAKSETSLQMATSQLEGGISEIIKNLILRLKDLYMKLEVAIDFCEDVDSPLNEKEMIAEIEKNVLAPLEELLRSYEDRHFLREGLRLLILGKPNVGKSSLLNRLLKKNRAIVTEVPGTTRDSLEEVFIVDGLPVNVIDTAGWQETNDPVEKIGIQRARDLVKEADLVLFMVDAGTGIGYDEEIIYDALKEKETILVVNKTDLLNKEEKVWIPEKWKIQRVVRISAKYNQGVQRLKQDVYDFAVKARGVRESAMVPNLRQKKLLMAAREAVKGGGEALGGPLAPEIIAIDIRDAMEKLKEIIGENVQTDILESIFSQFCIGK